MKLNEALDRIAKGRATIGDIGFVVAELRAAKADKGAAYWRERAEIAEGELRIAKREAVKLLKGQMVNDSRIIGKLKRENRKMFEAFCKDCHHRCGWRCVVQTGNKASMITAGRSNCPLLKGVSK